MNAKQWYQRSTWGLSQYQDTHFITRTPLSPFHTLASSLSFSTPSLLPLPASFLRLLPPSLGIDRPDLSASNSVLVLSRPPTASRPLISASSHLLLFLSTATHLLLSPLLPKTLKYQEQTLGADLSSVFRSVSFTSSAPLTSSVSFGMAQNKKRSLKEMLHLSLQDPTANTPVQTQGFTTEKNPSPPTIPALNGLSTVPCLTPTSQSPTRMAQNKKKSSKKKLHPTLQSPTVNTPGLLSQSFTPSLPTIPTVNELSSSTWMLVPPTLPYMTPNSQSPTSQSPEDQSENNGQPPKKKAVSVTTTHLTENEKKTLGTKIRLEYDHDLKAGYRPHDMKITRVVCDIATIVRQYIPMTAKRFVDLPIEVQARVENDLTIYPVQVP